MPSFEGAVPDGGVAAGARWKVSGGDPRHTTAVASWEAGLQPAVRKTDQATHSGGFILRIL